MVDGVSVVVPPQQVVFISESIAELRARDSDNLRSSSLSYVDDVGFFQWNPDSLDADNGTTIIKPDDKTSLQAGRWMAFGSGGGGTGVITGYSSITALRAAPTTNLYSVLAVPGYAGTFVWNSANLSSQVFADPLMRWFIPPVGQTGSLGAWQRVDSTGKVDITLFGAVGDGATDNATAIQRALAVAAILKRPITGPNAIFCTSQMIELKQGTGIVGDGSLEFRALPGTQTYWAGMLDAYAERPIIRVGWKFAELNEFCTVPLKGFKVRGLSVRTALRSSDPLTSAFLGTGILYDESAYLCEAQDVEVSFCYKGINHNNLNGHIGGIHIKVSNCWYNMYWQRQTGDYRYYNCDMTGALFAAYGSHSDLIDPGIMTGGFVGFQPFTGCHAGFAPYVFYQPEGSNGTVGHYGVRLIDCPAEQVGNSFYKGGRSSGNVGRVSFNNHYDGLVHGWTNSSDTVNYNNYTIQGDGNFPVKEPMRIETIQGAGTKISGQGLVRGTFAGITAHTIIDNLQNRFRDEFDPSGITVINNDKGLVLGLRETWLTALSSSAVTLTTGGEFTIVTFTLPQDMNNTVNFLFQIQAKSSNSNGTATDIVLRQKLNNLGSVQIDTIRVAPGSQPFTYFRAVSVDPVLAGRTVAFSLTTPTNGVAITAGQATFASINASAI